MHKRHGSSADKNSQCQARNGKCHGGTHAHAHIDALHADKHRARRRAQRGIGRDGGADVHPAQRHELQLSSQQQTLDGVPRHQADQ